MDKRIITPEEIREYAGFLIREEKSRATCEKYLRDLGRFSRFCAGRAVTKDLTLAWKGELGQQGYAARSINSMLASLNSFLSFMEWGDCCVKSLRIQRQTYRSEEQELTKGEYLQLLTAAGRQSKLNLLLQTICATGIRVSEVRYFTVEGVKQGQITIFCKSKTRTILIPGKLRKMLLRYARERGFNDGPIFRNSKGGALDRSTIWRQMKQLCAAAGVRPSKVYPHNLRKLFARAFYAQDRDIAKLADILGHSSINTTRIYIISTGVEHRRKIEQLGLVI